MKMGYSELLYKKHLLDEEYIILGGILNGKKMVSQKVNCIY